MVFWSPPSDKHDVLSQKTPLCQLQELIPCSKEIMKRWENRLLCIPPEIVGCLHPAAVEILSICDNILSNQKLHKTIHEGKGYPSSQHFESKLFSWASKANFFIKILILFKAHPSIFLAHRFSISMFLGSHNHCFHSIDFLALQQLRLCVVSTVLFKSALTAESDQKNGWIKKPDNLLSLIQPIKSFVHWLEIRKAGSSFTILFGGNLQLLILCKPLYVSFWAKSLQKENRKTYSKLQEVSEHNQFNQQVHLTGAQSPHEGLLCCTGFEATHQDDICRMPLPPH